jgi:hypothetical protein
MVARDCCIMDISYLEENNSGENESHLDSHADTSACGSNMIVLDGTITDYADVDFLRAKHTHSRFTRTLINTNMTSSRSSMCYRTREGTG